MKHVARAVYYIDIHLVYASIVGCLLYEFVRCVLWFHPLFWVVTVSPCTGNCPVRNR